MAATSRRSLCEEHIAELATVHERLAHVSQQVMFLSADVRKLTDMVVDFQTRFMVSEAKRKMALAGLAAAMGAIGSLVIPLASMLTR